MRTNGGFLMDVLVAKGADVLGIYLDHPFDSVPNQLKDEQSKEEDFRFGSIDTTSDQYIEQREIKEEEERED